MLYAMSCLPIFLILAVLVPVRWLGVFLSIQHNRIIYITLYYLANIIAQVNGKVFTKVFFTK